MINMIGELIKGSGLKNNYIAEQLEVSQNTVTNWCKGKSTPSLEKSFELADLLGCKVDDFFKRDLD